MKESVFQRWLYTNKCFLTRDSELEITHISMDGGRLHIPGHLISEFVTNYSKGLIAGERYYICETVSKVIKLYVDFDYIADDPVDEIMITNISRLLRNATNQIFGKHYDFIICTNEPKHVQKNKKKCCKSGIHIIWKDLYVTPDNAKRFSMFLRTLFEKELPGPNWTDIIDTGVFSAGLRMVGSRKIVTKKRRVKQSSGSSVDSESPTANDMEVIKVDEGRAYIPFMEVVSSGVEKLEEEELSHYGLRGLRDIISRTMIRTYNNERSIEPDGQLPELDDVKKKIKSPEDPKVWNRVEAFIRYQTITQWDSPLVYLKQFTPRMYIAKIESMYCLNVQREHNQCGIYFQITESGLYQRCYCRCDTVDGRLDGMCKNYKSAPFPIPIEVMKMLFPDNQNKKTRTNKSKSFGQTKELFASNLTMKSRDTLHLYLKMSMDTILEIENKCNC